MYFLKKERNKMKKNIISKKIVISIVVLVITCLIIGILISVNYNINTSKYKGQGTNIKETHGDTVLIVEKNLDCIPVVLYLYDDNTYELFTEYRRCKHNKWCTLDIKYNKSIKGKYEYNLNKIIDKLTYYEDNINSKDIDYEITIGKLVAKDKNHYVVLKGQNNELLEEFLKMLDIDLNICATFNYTE